MSERFYFDPHNVDYSPPLVSVAIVDRESTDHCICYSRPFAEKVTAALNAAEESKAEIARLRKACEVALDVLSPSQHTLMNNDEASDFIQDALLAESQLPKGESDGDSVP